MAKIKLTIVIPIFNGETKLKDCCSRLVTKLSRLVTQQLITNYAIVFVNNGSTDGTSVMLKNISKQNTNISTLATTTRGIGLALKLGLSRSQGDYIYFTAVDHPFNFDDLDGFLAIIDDYDLIFASKNNPVSVYQAPVKRKLASLILSTMVKTLFGLPLTDTQGTFIVKKKALVTILPRCNSIGPFFQAQLAINAQRQLLRLGEIPVVYRSQSSSSSFSLAIDGLAYLVEALREKFN